MKNRAIQVITNDNLTFESPHPQINIAKTLISNATWIDTAEGTVLIDTLLSQNAAGKMRDKINENGGSVKYIIYTHHHNDHLGGAMVFKDDCPEIIAQRYLIDEVEKYHLLKEHRARIASIQFNIPFCPDRLPVFLKPTTLFDEEMTFLFGGKTFELFHAKGETEDATWVYVPELETAFVGDLIISGFPNIGNPYKPTRFALPWIKALKKIREKKPHIVIAHGGRAVYKGTDAKELLDITIEGMESVHNQVIDCINRDIPVEEMIHIIKLPDHLKDNQYLVSNYSRIEFAVYNIYRWYHGYFDHNPANLLPRPQTEVNSEIVNLIGDTTRILDRSKKLHKNGEHQLAIQVLDILLKHDPENIDARKLHLELLRNLGKKDNSLMSKNTWVYFIEKDLKILEAHGEPAALT